jgi:hypothetical protein
MYHVSERMRSDNLLLSIVISCPVSFSIVSSRRAQQPWANGGMILQYELINLLEELCSVEARSSISHIA